MRTELGRGFSLFTELPRRRVLGNREDKKRGPEQRGGSMSYARPAPVWSSPTASRLHPPRSSTPTRPGQSARYSPSCREEVFSETEHPAYLIQLQTGMREPKSLC